MSNKMTGYFISIEGPDGAGKSSVLKGLLPRLERYFDQEIILTREPGGSDLAEIIRELILNPEYTEMDARTEALLYAASRRQHLKDTIIPGLENGKVIVSDRFLDSSLAYQGSGREIGFEEILQINEFAIQGLRPTITIYLDVDAEVGLTRIKEKRDHELPDRLENEAISFHHRVQEGYSKIISKEPERFIKVNADQSLQNVIDEAWDKLVRKLENRRK